MPAAVKRWRRVEKRNYSDIERGRQHFSESFFLELVTSGVIRRLDVRMEVFTSTQFADESAPTFQFA